MAVVGHAEIKTSETPSRGGRGRTTIARALAWLVLLIEIFLTLSPPRYRPHTGIEHHVEHLLALMWLGMLLGIGYPRHRRLIALVGIPLAGVLEALQLLRPGRHGTFSDFVTNSAGLCAGLALAALVHWIWLRCTAGHRRA